MARSGCVDWPVAECEDAAEAIHLYSADRSGAYFATWQRHRLVHRQPAARAALALPRPRARRPHVGR